MRMGMHDLNQCDDCGHYEWAHNKDGCPICNFKCKNTFIAGQFTRVLQERPPVE